MWVFILATLTMTYFHLMFKTYFLQTFFQVFGNSLKYNIYSEGSYKDNLSF